MSYLLAYNPYNTNLFMKNRSIDPAAQAYFNATGITGDAQQQAINSLVKSLKQSGLWSKMKAVYPFVTDNRNLLSYTEDFSNAYWSKSGATVTANNTTAPDGTLTADRVVYGTTNNYVYGVSTLLGGVGTQSFYVKGTAGETLYADDGYTSAPLITLTGNWQRVEFTTTRSSGQLHGILIGTYSGATARTIWLWGAQVDSAATATTYQPIATTQQAFISNQFKYNLKDPRDTDAAFRLVFNGGWSFSTDGATPNGVNGYADTKLVPSSSLSTSSAHLSFYSRTNINQNTYDFSAGQHYSLLLYNNTFYVNFETSGQYNATQSLTNTTGYYIGSRINNTSVNGYRNGIKTINNVAQNSTLSASPLFLSATNSGQFFSTKQIAFATIGDGLTDDDATNLYYYTQVFQTTLGRQVGSPAYALPTVSDINAKLYLSAIGSTTDSTLNNAVDTFIKGLKADGIYSKMKAVYPFATDNRNLLSFTEDFSNGFWSNGGITLTTNSTTAPNGTTTADSLIENTANSFKYVGSGNTVGSVSGTSYTGSVYAKSSDRYLQITFNSSAYGSGQYANFNLMNGTLGTYTGGTPTITSVGNGWYRCSFTAVATATTSTENQIYYSVQNSASATRAAAYIGNGTSGIFVWGAQLELGSTATTYQPILGSQQSYISNQFKYNMVNPQDDDSAFRLVFNGGWTHSANGATPNGTNGYADTKLVPSSVLLLDSVSLSFYSRTNIKGDIQMGVNDAVNYLLQQMNSSTQMYSQLNGAGSSFIDAPVTQWQGLFTTTRTSSSNVAAYKNGINIKNDIKSSTARPTKVFYLGARNNDGVAGNYDIKQAAFASIGDGLTDTEAANLYSRVQALQTALNRQV